MSTHSPKPLTFDLPSSTRIAVVAARFNAEIVDKLLEGCIRRLKEIGLEDSRIETHRVPGAFELPVAAKMFVDTKRYDAVILLGCVIRGETYHFEVIANAAAQGVMAVTCDTGIPVTFGVLTTDTVEQAVDRAGVKAGNKGAEAAVACIEMVNLYAQLPGAK